MIDLCDIERMALADIVRAGSDGVILDGRRLPLSAAVRLEMAGFVKIDHARPQRVRATAQGAAHQQRQVWA